MSRMNQVIQIGEIEGNIHYYIEDYAYTFLKKQKGKEKTKYFLYGEQEEKDKEKKLYIYGIAEKPKMEQTYFKEYYPLGFLKVKDEERFWITLKGQEYKMEGFYVFYAPNQAMQEYLVDHHEIEKEDKPEGKTKRQPVQEVIPIKEVAMPSRRYRTGKRNKENQQDNFIYSFVGIAFAVILVFLLTSSNGQKKIEIFKQVVAETMANTVKETQSNDILIEEKSITHTDNVYQKEEILLEEVPDDKTEALKSEEYKEQQDERTEEAVQEEIDEKQTEVISKEENIYDEYIVKEGDSLAAICNRKYGSLSNIQKICTINNIENADYIEPGQKIYLPR